VTDHLVACSWNVHECVGGDGRRDPGRVAAVLGEISADLFALQEVHSARGGGVLDQARFLADTARLQAVAGPTLTRRGGDYGNLLLTRLPVRSVRRHDLSVPGREPRGALEALLESAAGRVRVVVTHLGLRARERATQVRWLLDGLGASIPDETLVVAGDWNEWLPWRTAVRLPRLRFGDVPAPRTFPARCPILALDRVWVEPSARLLRLAVHRSPLATRASDHLPLVVRLQRAPARQAE
jgi:endonuclease/exonuclease/phosphatase family metal-dependent hydrolase